jgi:hypothetical protein
MYLSVSIAPDHNTFIEHVAYDEQRFDVVRIDTRGATYVTVRIEPEAAEVAERLATAFTAAAQHAHAMRNAAAPMKSSAKSA